MTRRLLTAFAILFVSAAPALGQARRASPPPQKTEPEIGVRVGVSGDPDQFFFGAHVETAPLLDHLTFRPNAEVGFGDDQTLIAFNFEFAYSIPIQRQPWRVYLGAGPALIIDTHSGNTDAGGGLNFLVGLQHRKGLFAELKVGAIDSPSVKFAVGYVFK